MRWRIVGPFNPDINRHHAALAEALRDDRDWIEFTGELTDRGNPSPVQRKLAESALMVLPFADGASTRRTSLQTGWAFGLPIITTPPPQPIDAIQHGENCLLVSEPTPQAWASAIGRVLRDVALAARLGEGSLETAERFSWARLAENHLAVYDALLEGRS